MGWGREGERENKIKQVGRTSPYPYGVGEGIVGGRGPGSAVQRGCPQPTHTHPRYVQYKSQIITTAKEEKRKGGPGGRSEVGKARKGTGIKFHIFTTFI